MSPNNKKKSLTETLLEEDPPRTEQDAWDDIMSLLLKQPDVFIFYLIMIVRAFGGSVTTTDLMRNGLNVHAISQIANRAAALQKVTFDGITIKLK
jgi:hypothetical protein